MAKIASALISDLLFFFLSKLFTQFQLATLRKVIFKVGNFKILSFNIRDKIYLNYSLFLLQLNIFKKLFFII